MLEVTSSNQLIERINGSDVYIYGAGYIAGLFWDVLNKHELECRVRGVLVSEKKRKLDFKGIGIKSIQDYCSSDNDLICVAVHEAIAGEIIRELEKRKIQNYVWVTPLLEDLNYGESFVCEKTVLSREFSCGNADELGMALRWCVIDQFYGRNNRGYDLYKRGISSFCGIHTAEARLKSFVSLIEVSKIKGYRYDPILVNDKFEIIDGEHRFALAIYLGVKEIRCRIVEDENFHDNRVKLTEDILKENGFSSQEIDYLKELNSKINLIRSSL